MSAGTDSGIYLTHSDTATINIKNNIISNCEAYGINDAGFNDAVVNDNILYNNTLGTSTGFTLDITGDDANLTTDPLFHTTGSNFHLQSTSPAIGAGTNDDDIGAFEFIDYTRKGTRLIGIKRQ